MEDSSLSFLESSSHGDGNDSCYWWPRKPRAPTTASAVRPSVSAGALGNGQEPGYKPSLISTSKHFWVALGLPGTRKAIALCLLLAKEDPRYLQRRAEGRNLGTKL